MLLSTRICIVLFEILASKLCCPSRKARPLGSQSKFDIEHVFYNPNAALIALTLSVRSHVNDVPGSRPK